MVKAIQTAKIVTATVKGDWKRLEEAELKLTFKVKHDDSKVVGTIRMFDNETSFRRLKMLKEFASVDLIEHLPGATISIATVDGKLVGFGSDEKDKFIDLEGAIGYFSKDTFFGIYF